MQINNYACQNKNTDHTNTYGRDEYPHEAFVLPGNDVFQVSAAGGESLAHLDDSVCLTYRALV